MIYNLINNISYTRRSFHTHCRESVKINTEACVESMRNNIESKSNSWGQLCVHNDHASKSQWTIFLARASMSSNARNQISLHGGRSNALVLLRAVNLQQLEEKEEKNDLRVKDQIVCNSIEFESFDVCCLRIILQLSTRYSQLSQTLDSLNSYINII